MNINFIEGVELPANGEGINYNASSSAFAARNLTDALYGKDGLIEELRRSGAKNIRIGAGWSLKKDGTPGLSVRIEGYAVSVFYTIGKTEIQQLFTEFNRLSDNIWAAARTVEYFRAIRRYGGNQIANRAESAFAALPEPTQPWWRVLGVSEDEDQSVVKAKYLVLAKKLHPDNGGSADEFAKLSNAYQQSQERTELAK